jgi:ferredoxin-NADP reductase
MFLLPSGVRRAYSIAYSDGVTHLFIIKRLDSGKGGSKEICDLDIGAEVEIMKPMGHFVLRATE